jgi:crossover junction endodeoxyribonuclease RusA
VLYEIELPWPPSINGYWRNFRGRQIISKRGREYRKLAIEIIKNAGLFGEQINFSLSVSIDLHPPTLRKYDIDNFCKGVFDALTEAKFWVDDDQIALLKVAKMEKTKGGKVVLRIDRM